MSIDVPKIIYIYVIILVVMYVCIIDGNVAGDISSFNDRSDEKNSSVVLDTDYNNKKASLDFARGFANGVNTSMQEKLDIYFDEEYYKSNMQNIAKAVNNKLKVRDTKNNENYVEFVREFKNEENQNVYVYNILVVKKNVGYPESFSILNEENSKDKNKSIDIHIIEISPYNYVIQIPEKEFVG